MVIAKKHLSPSFWFYHKWIWWLIFLPPTSQPIKEKVGYRVNQLVIEHFSNQGGLDPKGGLCCFCCPKQTWTPRIGAYGTLKIVKHGIELKKIRSPKIERSRTQKKPPNVTKANSRAPEKILVCCFVAIKVPRWFEELQVALLQHFKLFKMIFYFILMRFESRRGQNEEKWKKTCFSIRENVFSLLFFFGWSLGFAFQRWIVKLEKALI